MPFLIGETGKILQGLTLRKWKRGQEGAKTNFPKTPLIGETHFLPPIKLVLDLFRITGYEGEKFLSAVPDPT